MALCSNLKYDTMDATRSLTMYVIVRYRNVWRLRLGASLMRIGAWVAGFGNCEITSIEDKS